MCAIKNEMSNSFHSLVEGGEFFAYCQDLKNKFIDNVYGALIRGRDRMEKTDYQLPETKSE